jgi:hypothetical protein
MKKLYANYYESFDDKGKKFIVEDLGEGTEPNRYLVVSRTERATILGIMKIIKLLEK